MITAKEAREKLNKDTILLAEMHLKDKGNTEINKAIENKINWFKYDVSDFHNLPYWKTFTYAESLQIVANFFEKYGYKTTIYETVKKVLIEW